MKRAREIGRMRGKRVEDVKGGLKRCEEMSCRQGRGWQRRSAIVFPRRHAPFSVRVELRGHLDCASSSFRLWDLDNGSRRIWQSVGTLGGQEFVDGAGC
ncbi:hypothetical protein WN48_06387 [Eufriesea mexicana]|uniref:Uncharacterized protein n=1 Tax=Eufriesea mexicana TaxID=516756 RepID=A0A310SA98_9HYME|nr:hypothetical protein WN48_06387 [Eufriesea mexicana]